MPKNILEIYSDLQSQITLHPPTHLITMILHPFHLGSLSICDLFVCTENIFLHVYLNHDYLYLVDPCDPLCPLYRLYRLYHLYLLYLLYLLDHL